MSQSGMTRVAESVLPPGVIEVINGDTGSITGHNVTIYANKAAFNCGATVSFVNSGTVSTLNLTDDIVGRNILLGYQAGGAGNTLGTSNVSIGAFSFYNLNNGGYNVALGTSTAGSLTSGVNNVAIGYNCNVGTTGSDNVCVGGFICPNLTTGNGNTVLGDGGDLLLSNESYNILVKSRGATGESNAIRIGTQYTSGPLGINTCYIAGIVGVTTSNSQFVTINSSTGQLGVATGPVAKWTDVTSSTQTLAVANGYITDRGGGVTYTLPSTAALGDQIQIVGKAGIATITPNANQQINIEAVSGTVGATGTAVAAVAGCCITLTCTTSGSSTVWRASSVVGNWTLT